MVERSKGTNKQGYCTQPLATHSYPFLPLLHSHSGYEACTKAVAFVGAVPACKGLGDMPGWPTRMFVSFA